MRANQILCAQLISKEPLGCLLAVGTRKLGFRLPTCMHTATHSSSCSAFSRFVSFLSAKVLTPVFSLYTGGMFTHLEAAGAGGEVGAVCVSVVAHERAVTACGKGVEFVLPGSLLRELLLGAHFYAPGSTPADDLRLLSAAVRLRSSQRPAAIGKQ